MLICLVLTLDEEKRSEKEKERCRTITKNILMFLLLAPSE
jgi:hypothetical protein